MAIEGADHHFARTKRISSDVVVDSGGVTYLGFGTLSFSRTHDYLTNGEPTTPPIYFEKFGFTNYHPERVGSFHLITLTPDNINAKTINSSGIIVDEFNR